MNKRIHKIFSAVFLAVVVYLVFPLITNASPPQNFQTTQVIGSGLSSPTGFGIAPDGRIFILQRTGEVKIYKNGQILPNNFVTLPSANTGDRGLIGVAFDPDFDTNHFVYFYYTSSADTHNYVVRFTAETDQATQPPVIIYQTPQTSSQLHVGGTIAFGADGKLYIAVGDNGYPPNAQDLNSHYGKIIRLNKDGTIPSDNPFVSTPNAADEIWALGLRNPFRFQFDSQTGALYVGDVGNSTWEEVNLINKGANYGWPTCEGACSNPSFVNPIYTYPHNGASAAIAMGPVYRGNMFPSEYQNRLFFADYAMGFIRTLRLDNLSAVDFDPNAGSVVDLKTAPDGSIYYITFFPGRLYRISYSTTNQIPVASSGANVTKGIEPLTVNFTSNGSFDPDGGTLTYSWNFGDGSTSTDPNPVKTYTQKGSYIVDLTVSDGPNQAQAIPISIQVGIPPEVTIGSPVNNSTYKAGDTIIYTSAATDAAGLDINDNNISTEVLFHHGTHTHPFLGPVIGRNGDFTTPTSGETSADTRFEIIVTATDDNGLSTTKTVNIYPQKSVITVDTFPTGMQLNINGSPVTTPHTFDSVVNFQWEVSAPLTQVKDGQNRTFTGWSNGLAATHNISAPSTDTTYTAFYDQFVFTAVGDYGTSTAASSVLNGVSSVSPNLHLALGDLSYGQVSETQWCNFVKTRVGDNLPFELIAGNHDLPPEANLDSFASCLPHKIGNITGSYAKQYYFDYYGLARFIFISPNLTIDGQSHDYTSGTTYYTWLSNAIDSARSSGIPWVVVNMHKVCQNMGNKSCETGPDLINLLVNKKVDLVLQAHDHTYQRGKQLSLSPTCTNIPVNFFNSNCVIDDGFDNSYTKGQGTVFVIVGTGGDENYNINTGDTEAGYFANGIGSVSNPHYGFVKTTVTPTSLSAQFVGTTNPTGFTDNFTISSTPPPPSTGFLGEYYSNQNLSGTPSFTRTDSAINFFWEESAPAPNFPADNFSVRWSKQQNFTAGTYRFTVTADDGVRLFIDDQLVLDKWIDQPPTTYNIDRSLTQGSHTIKMEYYENGIGATAVLSLASIGTPTPTPIPPPGSYQAEYFTNRTLSGTPALIRNDNLIDFDWGTGSPATGIPADNFSVRWTKTQSFSTGTYRFTATGDDGIKLKIDGATILDKWIDQPATTYTVDHALTAGNHTIVFEFYENGADAEARLSWVTLAVPTPTPTPTPGPTPTPTPTPIPGTGFTGEYFTNRTLSGSPAVIKSDPVINFDWSLGQPDPLIPADNFSVRWTKTQSFSTGTYRFTVTADDGVRLIIDGVTVIDKWIDQPTTTYTVDRALTAGNHTIRMEYYENGADAVAQLSWTQVGVPPTPTPTPTLGPTPTPTPVPNPTDFLGQYYSNRTLSGTPTLTRSDPQINFNWSRGQPDPLIPADNFSVRWTKTTSFNSANYRFTVTADDGVRLFIDDQLVLDKWIDQPQTTYLVDRFLTAGNHTIRMEYYENGADAIAVLSWTEVSSSGNFTGEYFTNKTLSGSPTVIRSDPFVNFDWGTAQPDPLIPADNFSVRWTKIENFTANTYTFTVRADDGVRLIIDGVTVLDRWVDQGATTYTIDRTLTAGNHTIVIEYYENGVDAVAQASWQVK